MSINRFSSSVPYTKISPLPCADLHIVPMFTDNYGYVIIDRDTQFSAVVDPGDPQPIIDYLNRNNLVPNMVWCTHKHGDHSGGNQRFKDEYPNIEIISTKYEETPAATKLVGEGDSFTLGNLNVNVIHTP